MDSDPNDADLLLRWLDSHDQEAFAMLVARYLPLVRSTAQRLVGSAGPAADDVAQATFLILARKAVRIDATRSLAGWLHGVATRLALNARRQVRRRREFPLEAAVHASAPSATEAAAAFAAHIDEALARLPDLERAAILLHHVEGRSHAEIARLHGVAEGTVASWTSRGRERLRRILARRGLAVEGMALVALCAALPTPAASAEQVASTCSVATGAASASAGATALAVTLAWSWHGLLATCLGMVGVGLGIALALGGQLVSPASVEAGPPVGPVARAAIVVTPCEADATAVLHDIARQGGPRTLVFPGLPQLLVPPLCRCRPQQADALIQQVAAYAGDLQVTWLRDGRYAVLHPPAADQALEQVRRDLADTDPQIRSRAVARAAWISDPRVVPLLVAAAQDHDARLADRARIGLRRLGWDLVMAIAGDATPLLQADLRSPDVPIRERAVAGLAVLAEAQAMPLLDQALGDTDGGVRYAACASLGLLGGAEAFARLEAQLAGADDSLRLGALDQLARNGDEQAISSLTSHFTGLDAPRRRSMAYIVGRAGGPQADRLIERMMDDPEAMVRFGAMDGLGQAQHRARPMLIRALERECASPDPDMRRLAAWALGGVADARGLELLDQAIRGPDGKIREAACRALRRASGDSAMPTLERLLLHQDQAIANSALQALGNVADGRACDLIAQALGADDPLTFAGAVRALGRVGRARALPLLERFITSPKDVDGVVIEVLGRLGGARQAALLQPSLDHPDPIRRTIAAKALLRIGGEQEQRSVLLRLAGEHDRHVADQVGEALLENAYGDAELVARIAAARTSVAPRLQPAPVAPPARSVNDF